MSETPNRHLPLMEPSQSQPEVVYNAAMEILDVAESLEVEQSGDSPGVRGVTKLKFLGASVTDDGGGSATVTIDASSEGGGGGSLTVDTLTSITKITFDGPAVSVAAGATGEAVVTIDTVSGGSSGSSNVTPDTHPVSPDAMDDEFEGTILDAKWTWYNQSTASVVLQNGSAQFTGIVSGSEQVSLIGQPLPGGGAWRFRAKLSVLARASVNNAGVYLHETGSGKIAQFGLVNLSGSATLWVENAASFTAGGSIATNTTFTAAFPFGLQYPAMPIYFEIELLSGNLHFRLSNTGMDGTFVEFLSIAQTSLFTTTPNVIGLGGYSFNASTPTELFCDWFRRFA